MADTELQLVARIIDRLRRTFQFYADVLRPDDAALTAELTEGVRLRLGPDWATRRYADIYEAIKSMVDARVAQQSKMKRPESGRAPAGVQ